MSGFFSLLPDLLPMIMPSEVQITKASDLAAQRDGKDAAMIRQGAVIGKSDRMCATGELSIYPTTHSGNPPLFRHCYVHLGTGAMSP